MFEKCRSYGLLGFAQLVLIVAMVGQPPPVSAQVHPSTAPEWLSDRNIRSADGYATLEWARASGDRSGLFYLTERADGVDRGRYVEGGTLTVLRTIPGDYTFFLQACTRNADAAPQCGAQSKFARLSVAEHARRAHAVSQDNPDSGPVLSQLSQAAALPELRPGLWYNPDRNGHGYSFYRVNHREGGVLDELHGNEFDLHGIWYTYEAKSLGSGSDVDATPVNYQPLAARLKLVQLDVGRYSGGIYVTRNGVEVEQGAATLIFEPGSTEAQLDWSADFKLERRWGSETLELLTPSDPADFDNISHFSGSWAPLNGEGYRVVYDIGAVSEAAQILFEDAAGDMTWVQAAESGEPAGGLADLCFYYVDRGYPPGSQGSFRLAGLGCDYDAAASSSNRNARRTLTDLDRLSLWASINLPYQRGAVGVGSFFNPATFRKTSNLHGIGFTPAGTPCERRNGVCSIALDWFTDGYYPSASVFRRNMETDDRELLVGAMGTEADNFPVNMEQAGRYVFELRMGGTADSSLLAESAELLVPASQAVAPSGLAIAWTDSGARRYRVSWTHPEPGELVRFELEEQLPGQTAPTVHLVAPSTDMAVGFDRSGGPFGLYRYRVRACRDDSDCSPWAGPVDWQVDAPPEPEPELPPANPETPPAPAGRPVFSADPASITAGTMQGEFSVDAQGAANYRVPLMTAPGSGGLAPALGLHYRSQAPNDALGVGWTIDGVSAITRCPKTREQDAVQSNRNVMLNFEDRFCLDGQRLVGFDGPYGADGSEYRLEVDNGSRILSYGRAGSGPERFEVWHGDGSVSHFGGTTDSRIEARVPGDRLTVLTWVVNRREDSSGNFIEYHYDERHSGAVESMLTAVRYTGNDRAGTSPYAELRFHYSTGRSDVPDAWYLGGKTSRNRLLSRIDSVARTRRDDTVMKPLRSWFLHYGTDGFGRKIIEQIEECSDSARGYCFAPTRFDWLKHETEISSDGRPFGELFPKDFKSLELADVNGDGRTDLLIVAGRSRFSLRVAFAQPGGTFAPVTTTVAIPASSDSKQPVALRVIDLDADGRQDVIYPKQSGSEVRWTARLSTGNGFGPEVALGPQCCGLVEPRFAHVLDFNGDGRADLLTHTGNDASGSRGRLVVLLNTTRPGQAFSFSEPLGLQLDYSLDLFPDDPNDDWLLENSAAGFDTMIERNPRSVEAFDYDGDGDVDLVGRVARRYIRCDVSCTSVVNAVTADTGGQTLSFDTSNVPDEDVSVVAFFIVFESDGTGRYSQGEVVALDAETGCEVTAVCASWQHLPRVEQMLQVEINGDGLADLAYRDSQNRWFYRLNTGAGFGAPVPLGTAGDEERSEQARFVDISGDGYPEFIYPSAVGTRAATWDVLANDLGSGFAAPETSRILFGNNQEGDSSILADFDGDGLVDNLYLDFRNGRVRADSTRLYRGSNRFSTSTGNDVNALATVTDGLGKEVRIEYGRLTNPAVHTPLTGANLADWGRGSVVFDLVAPVSVVRRATASSPTAAAPGGFQASEYHYVGARVQAGGRGFLGFAEVVQWNPASGIRINSRYRQDFPFTGLLADVLREHASAQHSHVSLSAMDSAGLAQWDGPGEADPSTGSVLPGATLAYMSHGWESESVVGSRHAFRMRLARKLDMDGSPGGEILVRIFTENQHDSLGRLLRSVEKTFSGEAAQPERIVTTSNTFLSPDTRWNSKRVSTIGVRHQRPGTPDIERFSAFEYDPVTGLKALEITEPDDARYRVETAYDRDAFGNRIGTIVSAADVPVRRSRLSYDGLGRFALSEYNHYGQQLMLVHRWNQFGTPLEVTDADGVVTESAADPMGRVYGHWTETGTWERSVRGRGVGAFCPAGTVLHSWTSFGGRPGEGACLDALQRRIREVREGFDGSLVFTDTQFDSFGRPQRVSEPYFRGESRHWNETVYDTAGRIVAISAADGNDLSIDHGANACGPDQPLSHTIVNGLGQARTELHNALGEKVTVWDHDCGALEYGYDAIGNLVMTRGVDGATVTMSYDRAGRRTAVHDPDKGSWLYSWNALGELRRQLDAKGQAMEYEYDRMGRVVRRLELRGVDSLDDPVVVIEHEERTYWQNSTASDVRGKGQVAEVSYIAASGGETIHRKRFHYDELGRSERVISQIDGLDFVEETTYDRHGRVFQAFDPSGDYRGVRHVYNDFGYPERLVEAREGSEGTVYREVRAMDARGNVSYAVLGNGVEVFASHDPASGRIQTLEAYGAGGAELQFVEYRFDVLGNLVSRMDSSGTNDILEEFDYDTMNRLMGVNFTAPSQSVTSPVQTMAAEYDAAGNILYKSDVGAYHYGQEGAGPHAVTRAGGHDYRYDANGNQVSGRGRTIEYSLFDKPLFIAKGAQSVEFVYGIAHERVSRRDAHNDDLKTTRYIGNVEYVDDGRQTWFKRHVAGVAEVLFYPATAQNTTRYIVRDHLGSPHNFTDEEGRAGNAVYLSFGAFGQRRAPDWGRPLDLHESSAINLLSNRGFTGHEHVDSMGLVHMNGRIYDPVLGRFLQADPLVQAPDNSQALNRYSYALNNPLSYTDPSGYFLKRFVKRWGRLIVAMVISAVLPGGQGILATAFNVGNVYAQAAITGFIAGAITAGTFKGAVVGALTGLAVAGIVQAYNTAKLGEGLVSVEDLVPDESTLQHLHGNGGEQSGLYRIELADRGRFSSASRIGLSQVRDGEVVFTNGVLNDFSAAVKNATIHLNQVGLLESSYVLNYNPTRGFLTDLLEASRDIVGAHTGLAHSSLARDLAGIVDQLSAGGVTGIQLVGHSQGGAITASALRFAQKSGMSLHALSGGGVSLNGAPVNAWLARERIGARYGVQVVSRHQFGDAVHVLGGLNLTNPLEVPIALLRAPALFSGDPSVNPHSMPCGNSTMLVCGGR